MRGINDLVEHLIGRAVDLDRARSVVTRGPCQLHEAAAQNNASAVGKGHREITVRARRSRICRRRANIQLHDIDLRGTLAAADPLDLKRHRSAFEDTSRPRENEADRPAGRIVVDDRDPR